MSSKSEVRVGVIGLGIMGATHTANITSGKVSSARLMAVSDQDVTRFDAYATDVAKFEDAIALMDSGLVDAVIIATPHFSHTPLGIAALERGLHVLVEKPISVHKLDCEQLIAAWTNPKQIFGAVFNQRCNPQFRKLRELIQCGELGSIQRINWIITNWYRTAAYYKSGSWRATWKGEGGGVLLNQCPHNLDLWQWLFGMPNKLTALCQFGRFHDIEVEDAVTAMMEYDDGATGVFITSTGEAPGVNRLEVVADRGRVLLENGKMTFQRTEVSVSEHCRTANHGFISPEHWEIDFNIAPGGPGHVEILQNFVNAIRCGEPLIAPAIEGAHSVELANAMLHSAFTQSPITLPLDGAAYAAELAARSR